MPGLKMNMGLGGQAGGGAYLGPVFGSDGGAAVAGSGGYGDTGRGTIAGLAFGPSGVTGGAGGGGVHGHALVFGVVCFTALLFLAWALPR